MIRLSHHVCMSENEYQMIFVTAPDLEIARKLVQGVVGKRLAACGKILAGVESHYWWEGSLETSIEFQLVFKTHISQAPSLQKWIVEHHPYDVPECVGIPIESGHSPYLEWIQAETQSDASPDKNPV